MIVTALLCGVFTACGVYLLLADQAWRRLGGLALIGSAVALLAIAAGGDTVASARIGVTLVLAAFALFLVQASFVRVANRRAADPRAPDEGAAR